MQSNPVVTYFKESFQELRRVTWPTKHQAVRLTLIVLVFSIVSALVIGVLDYLFGFGYQELLDLV